MELCYFIAAFLTQILAVWSQYYEECQDRLDSYTCEMWKSSGMCADYSYSYLMTENCQLTCGFCPAYQRPKPKIDCKDKRKSCFKWKRYCQPNSEFYTFMTRNCPRTCLFCEDENCFDKEEKCAKFTQHGYCQQHSRYFDSMRKNCEQSCKFCLGVVDKDEQMKNEIANYNKEFFCDFEQDECDWTNNVFEDTAEWLTGVDSNGPKTGYNDTKSYLYLDAKYDGYYGYLRLPWQLFLPINEMSKGEMCFHFMYQLDHGAELVVMQRDSPTLANKFPGYDKKLTIKTKSTGWTHSKVDVHVSDGFELVLKGVKGETESYVAIDYVFFTKYAC